MAKEGPTGQHLLLGSLPVLSCRLVCLGVFGHCNLPAPEHLCFTKGEGGSSLHESDVAQSRWPWSTFQREEILTLKPVFFLMSRIATWLRFLEWGGGNVTPGGVDGFT